MYSDIFANKVHLPERLAKVLLFLRYGYLPKTIPDHPPAYCVHDKKNKVKSSVIAEAIDASPSEMSRFLRYTIYVSNTNDDTWIKRGTPPLVYYLDPTQNEIVYGLESLVIKNVKEQGV